MYVYVNGYYPITLMFSEHSWFFIFLKSKHWELHTGRLFRLDLLYIRQRGSGSTPVVQYTLLLGKQPLLVSDVVTKVGSF